MPIVDYTTYRPEHLSDLAAYLRHLAAVIEDISASSARPRGGNGETTLSYPAIAGAQPARPSGNGVRLVPIADRATFSARWEGKTCPLGNTISFRLLERLSRRPNQLVPCQVLLREVWEGCRSREAVRSAVKVLRQKLASAGMEDLAAAIDGSTAHHYSLRLDGRF